MSVLRSTAIAAIVVGTIGGTVVGCGSSSDSDDSTSSNETSSEERSTSSEETSTTAEASGVDVDDVEQRVAAYLNEPPVQDAEVDCPAEVEAAQGESFECDVTANAGALSGSATVTLSDDTGEEFSLDYAIEGDGYKASGTATSVP